MKHSGMIMVKITPDINNWEYLFHQVWFPLRLTRDNLNNFNEIFIEINQSLHEVKHL